MEGNKTDPRRKSKRACDSCSDKHLKCNGEHPCERCISVGFTCTYYKPVVKRGTPSGKIHLLENLASSLQQQITIQNQLTNKLSDIVKSQQSNADADQHHLLAIQNPQQSPSMLFEHYITIYNSVLLPFVGVPPLSVSSASYFGEEAKPYSKILMTSILSQAAQVSGNLAHAEELHHRARSYLGDYYDATHPLIASSHNLIATYYSNIGDEERALIHNKLGLAISQRLLNTNRTYDGSYEYTALVYGNYIRCLIGTAEEEQSQSAFMNILTFVHDIVSKVEFKGKELLTFTVHIMKIYTSVFGSDLNESIRKLDESLLSIPQDVNAFTQLALKAMIFALRAVLYFYLGQQDMAIMSANMAQLKLSLQGTYKSPLSLASLGLIGQIYYYAGYFQEFSSVVEQLMDCSRCYPIAAKISQWIQDPSNATSSFPFINIMKPFNEANDVFPGLESVVPLSYREIPQESQDNITEFDAQINEYLLNNQAFVDENSFQLDDA